MDIWKSILAELEFGHKLIFMLVVSSEESSPGRKGFKMAVSDSGLLFGSIGGGIMEYKLSERCKQDLKIGISKPYLLKQVHNSDSSKYPSGMICSGEQTVVLYPIDQNDLNTIKRIIDSYKSGEFGTLIADHKGIEFVTGQRNLKGFETEIESEYQWLYKEDFGTFPVLHIIGGGHVSLALSKYASDLGFQVKVYDDRKDLSTLKENKYASCYWIEDYGEVVQHIEPGEQDYIVIMSYSHRADQLVLSQFVKGKYKYVGMLGSKRKVKEIFKELIAEGFEKDQLDKIHAPIGIPISSQTPKEISISIIAELISVKNRK